MQGSLQRGGEGPTEAARSGPGLDPSVDPPPVEWVNRDSAVPVLLLCEHAGQAIPTALGDLGLPQGAIDLHIGWDIGAERLARAIAERLGAPLILQRYSRLVIDCNRPPGSVGSIPEISDHVPIPGNQGLSTEARRWREQAIFEPLDAAIEEGFASAPRLAAFSIHSFTRQMHHGPRRRWDAGFLGRNDLATGQIFLQTVAEAKPDFVLAINQPYQIDEEGDWFIPHHAEPRKIPHCLIEICNDRLGTEMEVSEWADLLVRAMRRLVP